MPIDLSSLGSFSTLASQQGGLESAATMREFTPLQELTGDNFPRRVLTLDEVDFSENGIIHQSLIDWCLQR